MDIINEIIDRLSIFKNLYDYIRIVDPINKKTVMIKDCISCDIQNTCYLLWKKDAFCKNCISMRCSLENNTFVKLEYADSAIFLVTATPVEINGTTYIVEIIKNISQNGTIISKKSNSEFAEELLSDLNNKIITDDLTGAFNKRYINERLPVDLSNNIVKGSPLTIIMADIDYFKKVNDNHGHIIGDKVLKDFITIIKNNLRSNTDWVGRYGGEEFLIVLNETDQNTAFQISEKIRMQLEATTFKYNNLEIRITSSFGIHSLNTNVIDIENFISKADNNLYIAKASGRNKSIL
jgi:diguanylate cyclase (GGDEF)-like protein